MHLCNRKDFQKLSIFSKTTYPTSIIYALIKAHQVPNKRTPPFSPVKITLKGIFW
jgi:hypothetical protein